MDPLLPTPVLGGRSPAAFMRRHWQKQPLLVRAAMPGVAAPLPRAALFDLAASDDVESRLVQHAADGRWQVRHGPLPRRALPPLSRPGWTLLVQGLDLHVAAARALLDRFRFVPDARLDDLMVSWASDGGGVGPHVDSYDVFLLQVQGRRRWRVAPPQADTAFVPGAPLKLLRRFEPTHDWLLEPGDLLYLPPLWGHDGVAVGGDCVTCSIGFRAPARAPLARELLLRLADDDGDADMAEGDMAEGDTGAAADGADVAEGARAAAGAASKAARALYRDPRQPATATPAAVPPALHAFATDAVARLLREPRALARALGEVLTEPKPRVWFAAADDVQRAADAGVRLAAATRMLYDEHHVFINGEAYLARGRDARLMRRLADARRLSAADCARLGADAAALLDEWIGAGWVQPEAPATTPEDEP
jgi:50S ribosomal protein L16 3-hydroxylase